MEYREAAQNLALTNENLMQRRYQMEKDMVDVVGFMKKQEKEKDEMIEELKHDILKQKKTFEEEQKKLVEVISALENKYIQKEKEMRAFMSEVKMAKEFRMQKAELEKELEEVKENLRTQSKAHEVTLSIMEKRFIQDKHRMKMEEEKRIVVLAESAHSEAIKQLGESGRNVFKENVHLKKEYSFLLNEVEELKKTKEILQNEIAQLLLDKETNEMLIKKKALQSARKKTEIRDLQQNIMRLEADLQKTSLELDGQIQRKECDIEVEARNAERFQKMLDMQEREINRIKKLSANILRERSDVEHFFLEALTQVKQEIIASRNHYRKEAQAVYQRKMKDAASGKDLYPKIRTFHNKEHSTNDVYQDLQDAEKWNHLQAGKVDIKDLTWEEKERVLRLLFAKMNNLQSRKKSPMLALKLNTTEREERPREPGKIEGSGSVFLTQKDTEPMFPALLLPDIQLGASQIKA
ncbi:basal body-orientation factor 1 [Pelobates cultripes]|uniref:Basal body-orientation factor 1 n=1 Tax=Pelobates cultripes TaxID=61616 RepID=A0AAD1TM83_PELCU|nr:basal body-orientation factor 1 [Pelobates cultripes]